MSYGANRGLEATTLFIGFLFGIKQGKQYAIINNGNCSTLAKASKTAVYWQKRA
jgi:hypothetical protein